MQPETPVLPPVADDSGYLVRPADLIFVDLSERSLAMMHEQKLPLGMTEEIYHEFCQSLVNALRREGITNADVRLQGSSSCFFAGRHKSMPYARHEFYQVYFDVRCSVPSNLQLDQFVNATEAQWPNPENRPVRRPFDVLHKLGVDEFPSDYDVQISSDDALRIIRQELKEARLDPKLITVDNPTYSFVKKQFVDSYLLYLSAWRAKVSALARRPVSIALFDRNGPPKNKDEGQISSHFRDEDWFVQRATTP